MLLSRGRYGPPDRVESIPTSLVGKIHGYGVEFRCSFEMNNGILSETMRTFPLKGMRLQQPNPPTQN